MDLVVRPLNETDYQGILVGWWKDWGWEPPKKDFLPDEGKGGVIVFDGDTPICAGFLYVTNSKVAWVNWIISNKQYRKKPARREAIKLVVSTLTNISKSLNCKYVYTLFKGSNLTEIYKSFGYINGDSYTGEMIKFL
jgi:hypothetical protein